MHGVPFLHLSTLYSFLSMDFPFSNNGLNSLPRTSFISDLHKDNQQKYSRLSNWFFLWCLRPWMNNLPAVWWPTFRFMVLNDSWCVKFGMGRDFLLISCVHWCFCTLPKSCQLFILSNNRLYYVLLLPYSIDIISTLSNSLRGRSRQFLFTTLVLFPYREIRDEHIDKRL